MNEDSSISLYKHLEAEGNNLPIFLWSDWLTSVCQVSELYILKSSIDTNKYALLPVRKTKKLGFTILSLPPLTPFSSILFSKNTTKEEQLTLVNKLIENIKASVFQISFDRSFQYSDLFIKHGFRSSDKVSYIIDTSIDQNDLLNNLKYNTRRTIKSELANFSFTMDSNPDSITELNNMTFERQNKNVPYSPTLLKKLHAHFGKTNNAHVLIVKDKSGTAHAGLFLVSDTKKMYCLAIGSDPSLRERNAVTLAIWKGILHAKNLGLAFDFEGSSLPNVEPFFRRFGGEQIRYKQLTKVNKKYLAYLLELVYKI